MYIAPAKLILFGEHAVVYGQPAIAVPFQSLYAIATPFPALVGSGLTITARDVNLILRVDMNDTTPDNALVYAAQLAIQAINPPALPDLNIEVSATIPFASGFGSGAAIATALIRALSAALHHPIEGDALNALVFEVEKLHHGTPSGVDNTVIVKNAPVYFVREQPLETFTIGAPLTLVIADSGVPSSTKETVGAVRALYESNPSVYGAHFAAIGSFVNAARHAIEQGNVSEIGALMNRNHDLLRQITVSSPLLDQLTDSARQAGAYGAKLSGGGRGGNVIALVAVEDAPKIVDAFQSAGAVRTWTTTLG